MKIKKHVKWLLRLTPRDHSPIVYNGLRATNPLAGATALWIAIFFIEESPEKVVTRWIILGLAIVLTAKAIHDFWIARQSYDEPRSRHIDRLH